MERFLSSVVVPVAMLGASNPALAEKPEAPATAAEAFRHCSGANDSVTDREVVDAVGRLNALLAQLPDEPSDRTARRVYAQALLTAVETHLDGLELAERKSDVEKTFSTTFNDLTAVPTDRATIQTSRTTYAEALALLELLLNDGKVDPFKGLDLTLVKQAIVYERTLALAGQFKTETQVDCTTAILDAAKNGGDFPSAELAMSPLLPVRITVPFTVASIPELKTVDEDGDKTIDRARKQAERELALAESALVDRWILALDDVRARFHLSDKKPLPDIDLVVEEKAPAQAQPENE